MKIVIAGGGIAGLIAAYTFIRAGVRPTIVEKGQLGGQWAKLPALKYLRYDSANRGDLLHLVRSLGLSGETLPVKGGVMIPVMGRAEPLILPHPVCMSWDGIGRALLEAHWEKTRGDGEPDARVMNTGSRTSDDSMKIHVTGGSFLEALVEAVRADADVREGDSIIGITVHRIAMKRTDSIPYGRLVTTLPALIFRRLCSAAQETGKIPVGLKAKQLIVCTYQAPDFARRYVGWDYFYTPWTPYGVIHRLSPGAGVEWSVEHNRVDGDVAKEAAAISDARAILGGSIGMIYTYKGDGHLHPTQQPINYPENIYPLGRFAQWDSRCTVDRVYERALDLVETFGNA